MDRIRWPVGHTMGDFESSIRAGPKKRRLLTVTETMPGFWTMRSGLMGTRRGRARSGDRPERKGRCGKARAQRVCVGLVLIAAKVANGGGMREEQFWLFPVLSSAGAPSARSKMTQGGWSAEAGIMAMVSRLGTGNERGAMSKTVLKGIIHGKIIELEQESGLPETQAR